MSIGNSGFTDGHKEEIRAMCKRLKELDINISNKSFSDFEIENIKPTDFVYLDPPYLNTLAIYNEQQKWDNAKQKELFGFCDSLNHNEIKFAMSNTFSSRDSINHELIDWADSNKLNVYEFKDMRYTSCGRGNSNAKEVLITNY